MAGKVTYNMLQASPSLTERDWKQKAPPKKAMQYFALNDSLCVLQILLKLHLLQLLIESIFLYVYFRACVYSAFALTFCVVCSTANLSKKYIETPVFKVISHLKAYWLRDAPTGLTFNNCTLCPHCFYVFCIYLRIK